MRGQPRPRRLRMSVGSDPKEAIPVPKLNVPGMTSVIRNLIRPN